MKPILSGLLLIILVASCSSPSAAQTQNSKPTSSEIEHGEIGYQVQLQLLIASNIATAKTDYPPSLEAVVKQLNSSLPFKHHSLVATYLYNVAEASSLEVSDVTYAAFEPGGGLAPTFLNLSISGIKLNANSDTIHLTRFRFDIRKRIFIQKGQSEGDNSARPTYDSVVTGITTEINVRPGIPTIVGTITNALSDGVLVVVLTIKRSGAR